MSSFNKVHLMEPREKNFALKWKVKVEVEQRDKDQSVEGKWKNISTDYYQTEIIESKNTQSRISVDRILSDINKMKNDLEKITIKLSLQSEKIYSKYENLEEIEKRLYEKIHILKNKKKNIARHNLDCIIC